MPKQVEVQVSKLEGPPEAERGKFVQAYEYTPEEELLKERGKLFAVIDIAGDPNFDAALAGKLVWDTLSEEYYSEVEEQPLKVLERAILSAKDRLTNLGEQSGVGVKTELNLAAVIVWGSPPTGEAGVFYLARQGNPTLLLKRTGQVRELLTGEEPTTVTSLPIEDGDVVILGSSAFSRSFPPNALPEISFLEKEFAGGQQVPGMAAIILKLKVKEEKELAVTKLEERPVVEPFAKKPGLKLPSIAHILERLPKRRESLSLSSVKVRSGIGKFGSALEKTTRRVVGEVSTRISRGQEISLEKQRSKIGLPRIIVALAFVFFLSVAFTIWQQRQRVRTEEFNRLLSSVEATLAETEGLVGLADEKAKELWQKASDELRKAEALNPKNEKLTSLRSQTESLLIRIERITPVTEEHLFYDLTLQPFGLAQGGEVQGLSLSGKGETIYVAEGKTGATLAISQTTPPQVVEATANAVKGAKQIGVGGDFLYLLTGDGLYRYNLETGEKDNPLNFDRYDKVATFSFYLDRNIYFLVPSENQIYKFQFLETGGNYSPALNWLKESLVLEEAVDMAIDGSIWILLKDGTVINLFTGKKQPFSFKGLSSSLTSSTAIYTHPNLKYLYIADGNRVAVFEKNGQFVRQFKGEVLAGLVDLWVSADEKILFLLTKDKIYKVSL